MTMRPDATESNAGKVLKKMLRIIVRAGFSEFMEIAKGDWPEPRWILVVNELWGWSYDLIDLRQEKRSAGEAVLEAVIDDLM